MAPSLNLVGGSDTVTENSNKHQPDATRKRNGVRAFFAKWVPRFVLACVKSFMCVCAEFTIIFVLVNVGVVFSYSLLDAGTINSVDSVTILSAFTGGSTAGALYLWPHMYHGLGVWFSWIAKTFRSVVASVKSKKRGAKSPELV